MRIEGKTIIGNFGETLVGLKGGTIWGTSWARGDVNDYLHQVTTVKNLIPKSNLLRIPICLQCEDLGGTSIYRTPEVMDDYVKPIGDLCKELKIYFYTNFHGTDSRLPNGLPNPIYYEVLTEVQQGNYQGLINWHTHFCELFKDNPYFMGIEWWNEPPFSGYGDGLGQWDIIGGCHAVAEACLQVRPDLLFFVPSVPNSELSNLWDTERKPCYIPCFYAYAKDINQDEWRAGAFDLETGWLRDKHIDKPYPVACCEHGWQTIDDLDLCREWYRVWNKYKVIYSTWADGGNPDNYGGIPNDQLSPHWQIMAFDIDGTFPDIPVTYPCPSCGMVFLTQGELDEHVAAVHGVTQPVKTCVILAVLSGLGVASRCASLLTKLRLFRDRCLPDKLVEGYYGFSRLVVR